MRVTNSKSVLRLDPTKKTLNVSMSSNLYMKETC